MIASKRTNEKSTPKEETACRYQLARYLLVLVCSALCCVQFVQARKAKDMSVMEVTQQRVKVRGVVLDDLGEPLPGATVQIQGTTQGVITATEGDFEFDVPPTCKLIVSYLGMVTKTIDYAGESFLTIKLESTASALDEVTVVAFAKQRKESVIASITTVKPADLKVPSSNLTTAFAGRVAGLISYQTSGEPGLDNASFFIRGVTSFGADSKKDPLILIDGIELKPDDLARLNTDDIASFSIMKDAAATALYGARGANGIIMVTTKEGREGKVQVNARIETSFSSPTSRVEIADPVTFMKMHNESVKTRDPLGQTLYSSEKIYMTERGMYPDIFPATDWYDTMFKNMALNQRANLSLSGGGAIARYYLAVNFTQDFGNLKVDKKNNFNSNIDLKKLDVRSNINLKLTSTTDVGIRMNATFDDYRGPIDGGSEMYNKVIQSNPVLFKPYYEPDENYSYAKHILFGNYGNAQYLNPYAEVMKGYRDYSRNLMNVTFNGEQNLDFITENLRFRTLLNFTRNSNYQVHRNYNPYYYDLYSYNLANNSYQLRRINTDGTEYLNYDPNPDKSKPWNNRQITTNFRWESTLEWNQTYLEKHFVSALLVFYLSSEQNALADNLQLSLPKRNLGLSGRFMYDYQKRYFAEFVFGYNGTERFSKDKRFGFFPSGVVGWMISNESFFEPLKSYITDLKVRGSYGLAGQDQIGSDDDRFYYLSQVNLSAGRNVNWGQNMNYNPGGIDLQRYANFSIGWETSYKTNIGLEMALKNGFSTIAEFFQEKRENILIDRIIPNTMGIVPAVKANLGKAESKGVDIELNYEKSFNKDFWAVVRGTYTFAKSKVTEWEEPDYTATPWRSKVGYSVKQEWGYVAERLFVDDEEVRNSPTQFGTYMAGDIKYRDMNGDGRISELDMVPIGHPTDPEIVYGIGPSVGYKGFDFSFFFQGHARRSFFYDLGKVTPFIDGNGDDGRLGQNAIIKAFADSYWSEDNMNAYALWPRLSYTMTTNNNQRSTWFMQDASFLRLKSAEIGYKLPDHLLKKIHLANLRIYVSGTNLAGWSAFKLWDPELGENGLNYPLQRVINIGLNIGL